MVKARVQVFSLKNAISFICTCKREYLVPTFVRFRVANPYLADSGMIRQCRENILQVELKFKKHPLNRTTGYLNRLDQELKQSVPHIVYVRLYSISPKIVNRKMNEIGRTNESKLNQLRTDKLRHMPQQ